jgi:hypothetical protein
MYRYHEAWAPMQLDTGMCTQYFAMLAKCVDAYGRRRLFLSNMLSKTAIIMVLFCSDGFG